MKSILLALLLVCTPSVGVKAQTAKAMTLPANAAVQLQLTPQQLEEGFPIAPKRVIPRYTSFGACSCYLYASQFNPSIKGFGIARNIPVNSNTPAIGGLVVTYEGSLGHVAHIIDIDGDYLILEETNYSHCRYTNGRKLNTSSALIKGYVL